MRDFIMFLLEQDPPSGDIPGGDIPPSPGNFIPPGGGALPSPEIGGDQAPIPAKVIKSLDVWNLLEKKIKATAGNISIKPPETKQVPQKSLKYLKV